MQYLTREIVIYQRNKHIINHLENNIRENISV